MNRPKRMLPLDWDCACMWCPRHYWWQQTCLQGGTFRVLDDGVHFYSVPTREEIPEVRFWCEDRAYTFIRSEPDYSTPGRYVIAVRPE